MKKADIPKPKFNVGDTVVYDYQITDHHEVPKTVRAAGVIQAAIITIHQGGTDVAYMMTESDEMIQQDSIAKRVLLAPKPEVVVAKATPEQVEEAQMDETAEIPEADDGTQA